MDNSRRRWGLLIGATAFLGAGTALGLRLGARGTPAAAAQAEPASRRWTCPMHPHIDQATPGECPICGMALVPRDDAGSASGMTAPVLHLSEQVQQNSGVRTELVEARVLSAGLRVSGRVLADERRAISLSPKVDGWIKRLGVAGVGDPVKRGQLLYEIYSPDLQLRQREYVEILGRRDLLQAQAGSMKGGAGSISPDMMLGSVARERFRMRARLLAADMPEALIDELETSRRVREVVPVLAQHDGVVTALNVRVGAYVMPAQALLEYADLRAAWVELLLTPEQLGQLPDRCTLRLQSSVSPGVELELGMDGRAAVLNAGTGMARLRVPLPRPHPAFPAGAPVEGEIQVQTHAVMAIPSDAVLRSGDGSVVFVEREPHHFERRAVRVGPTRAGQVQVLDGLKLGERLVVNGQFLLSAELGQRSPAKSASPPHQGAKVSGIPVRKYLG